MSCLYQLPILVVDETHFAACTPKDVVRYEILFSKTIPAGAVKTRDILGKKTNSSSEDQRKFVVGKNNQVEFPNFCLPITTSIFNFERIIAFLFRVHISCIKIEYTDIDLELEDLQVIDEYTQRVAIGNRHIKITVNQISNLRDNNYESFFSKAYDESVAYLSQLSPVTLHPYVYSYEIVAVPKVKRVLSIVKLFNLCHVTDGWANKVYLNSASLKDYLQTMSVYNYVRSLKGTIRPSNDIDIRMNAFAVVVNEELDQNTRLYQIVILTNGAIEFIFTNLDVDISHADLLEKSKKWIHKHFARMMTRLHLEECIYDNEYEVNIKDYKLIDGFLSAFCQLKTDNPDLTSFSSYPGTSVIYKTKSTIRYAAPLEHTTGTIERFNYILQSDFRLISDTGVQQMLQPSVLLIRGENMTKLWMYNGQSIEYFNLLVQLIYGAIIKGVTVDLKRLEMPLDSRLELVLLVRTDPVLFGSREKNEGFYEYSQHVQRVGQRPVLINLAEYEVLKRKKPESVTDLTNQTNGNRLYLYCRCDEFPNINYHHFPGQMCIVRCTKKMTNKTQFNHCSASLGAMDAKRKGKNIVAPISFDSMMRDSLNYLPPIELADVLSKAICQRYPSTSMDELRDDFARNYGISPFIIERDVEGYVYRVKTEFDKTMTYGLIITERASTRIFIVLDLTTDSPLILNDELEKNPFFKSITRLSNINAFVNRFVEFVNNVLGTKFEVKEKVSDFLEQVTKETKTTFIGNNREEIVGMMARGKHLYLTPRIFNPGIKTINLLNVIGDPNNLPHFSDLNQSAISKYYFLYPSHRVVMVRYYGFSIYVRPFKKNVKARLIDFLAHAMNLVGGELEPVPGNGRQDDVVDGINDIYMTFSMIKDCKHDDADISEMMKNVLTSGKTEIQYLDKECNFVSWRNSKININDFNNFLSTLDTKDPIHRIGVIYEKIARDMNFTFVHGEQITRDEKI